MKNLSVQKIALMGLFIGLCYIGTMFNITFPLGGAKTMIHFGNIFCLLGALILGGVSGGICASIGMGLFDIFNGWIMYAPSTFILKFFIALICGLVFKTMKAKQVKLTTAVLVSCISGMTFNIIFSPIASFLTSKYILSTDADVAMIMTAWQTGTVFINAFIAIIVSYALYMALYPVLKQKRFD